MKKLWQGLRDICGFFEGLMLMLIMIVKIVIEHLKEYKKQREEDA